MEFSINREVQVFFSFVLCGAILYFCYDLFSVIRKQTKAEGFMVHLQDGLFWLVGLFILFFFAFKESRGNIRFYELLGAILGAVLYGLTLSRWVVPFVGKFLEFLSLFFKKILKILLTPLVFMYNIIYRCIYFVFLPVRQITKRFIRVCRSSGRRALRFCQKK